MIRRQLPLILIFLLCLPALAQAQRPGKAARPAKAGKKVVVFVGMPGAGKSTAAQRLADRYKTKKISTGDIIRNTIKQRGLPYNAQNDRKVAEEFAKKPGEIGRRSAKQVKSDKSKITILEGFRSPADLKTFLREVPDATVVSVEVGTQRRHNRMLKRGRAGEDNRAYLRDRDRSEVKRGVRDVMRKANVRIRPRGDSMQSLDRSIDRVVRIIETKGRPSN